MPYNRLAIILGNCLFPNHDSLTPDSHTLFFMAEDKGLCTHFKYHQHKLVLFLSAMRSHADDIRKKYDLHYKKIEDGFDSTFFEELSKVIEQHSINELITYEVEDHFFEKATKEFCDNHGVTLKIVDSPGFLNTKEDFRNYLKGVKKPFMHTFYQQQRKRRNILMIDDSEPLHGKWSFDEDNRKKLPKGITIPYQPQHQWTDHTKEVITVINKYFGKHPGSTDNFLWATTREQVLLQLQSFLKDRFQEFGPYEDAIDKEQVFVFHSVLSPYINMGLITPQEVVDEVLEFASAHDVHYPSVEGFIRQVIGWREFMRGIYHEFDNQLQSNHFGHRRKMKDCWYQGTTGVPPLDDSIKKAEKYGYTHHIERLMILGNIMLLCELHPDEVYKWFMEMYVDSADWVMAPNVYGMSQFSDGGIFATKPYIGGSNYILKMSNYSKSGEWPDMVNGLYWRFIYVNRETFIKNPRMSMMVRTLDKMDETKKEKIMKLAEKFINQVTTA